MLQLHVQVLLDIIMFILIAIASIFLILEHSQYQMFMILIMFIYLFYFLAYRLEKYMYPRNKIVIHSLDENKRQPQQIVGQTEQKSEFLRELGRRQNQKSIVENNMKQNSDRDNSIVSYLNRSRKAQSFSKSSILGQSIESSNGFNFLKSRQKASKSINESLQQRTQDMNNSYIRHMSSRENKTNQLYSTRTKYTVEYTNKYERTLSKLGLSFDKAKKLTNNVEKLCILLAREFYMENIQNIRKIIGAIQAEYHVKVLYKDIEGLQSGFGGRNYGQVQINLETVLDKLLSANNFNPDFPQKRNQFLRQMKAAEYLASKRTLTPSVKPQSSQTLKDLCKTRLTLNSYFYNSKILSLSGQQLIQKLQTLNDYIQHASSQQKQYETIPGSKLSQNQSQRLMTAFNICVAKINNIIGLENVYINYEVKSYFGWVRNSQGRFVVREVGSDYGHPYLYLLEAISGQPKEEMYAEPGRSNGYSVLLLYLWVLQLKETAIVRKSPKLIQIMSKYLELIVL